MFPRRSDLAVFALLSVSALGIALAAPAHAQLTVSLNQPSQSYDTRSGGQLLVFYGTIQNNTLDAFDLSSSGLSFPYTSAGVPLSTRNSPEAIFGRPDALPSTFSPGASFSGALFTAALDETTKPGVYDLSVSSGTIPDVPAHFFVQGNDRETGQFFESDAPYSITVTSPAAVPEASTTVSFGLLLTLGLGGVIAARRKKATAA